MKIHDKLVVGIIMGALLWWAIPAFADITPPFSQYLYYSHITGEMQKDPNSLSIKDKRGFKFSDREVVWIGQILWDQKQRPVKAHWYSPDGEVYGETRVTRYKDKVYRSSLPIDGEVPDNLSGRWRVVILTAQNEEIDNQHFYLGYVDMGVEGAELSSWDNPDVDINKEDAVTLFVKHDIMVNEDYSSVDRITKRVMILSDKGKEYAEVYIPFFQGVDDISIHYAYTITPDGEVIDAREYQAQTFAQGTPDYTAFRFLSMSMPAIQKGSIFEYQISVISPLPKVPGIYFDTVMVHGLAPIIEAKTTVEIPYIIDLNYYPHGVEMDIQKDVLLDEEKRLYQFTARMLPGVKQEILMPPWRDVAGELILSTAKSWDEIAQWWVDLTKDKADIADDIQVKVDELTQGAIDVKDKIKRIYTYVMDNIRYVGLNFGAVIYEPTPAADVFKNKYGDCKDQGMLLMAMFKAAGIESYMVLLRAGHQGDIQQELPTPKEFNHLIVLAQDGQDKYFLDPTAKQYPFGVLPYSIESRDVMVIKDGTCSFEHIPVSKHVDNAIKNIIDLRIGKDLIITGEMEIQWHGQENGIIRQALYQIDVSKKRDDFVNELLKGVFPDASRDDYTFEFEDNPDMPITCRIRFHIKDWLQEVGEGKYLLSLNKNIVKVPAFCDNPLREHSVELNYLSKQAMTINVLLPDTLTVEGIPENFSISNEYIANRITYEYKDSLLVQRQEIENYRLKIPLEDMPKIKKTWEEIVGAHRKGILLKKKD